MEDGKITFAVDGRELAPGLMVGWVLDDLLIPGMTQLDVLQRAGIPVINDALTLFRAQNKYVDSSLLAAGGALRYPVITGRNPAPLAQWLDKMATPAVIKPLVGFGGRGLRKLDDAEDSSAVLGELAETGGDYYAVPWIDNPGRDIRVYTLNHQAIFAIYRYAPPGKWITNARAGGVDIGENQAIGELGVYESNSCPTCEPPVLAELADFLAAAALDLDAALQNWRPSRVYRELDTDPDLFHPSKQSLVRD